MKPRYIFTMALLIVSLIPTNSIAASKLRPIILDPSYNHDKWITQPQDHIFKFAAYTSSFDGADDNDLDGDTDKWGIPEWVAFEIRKIGTEHSLANRPGWMTDEKLFNQGIAPSDDSYHVAGTTKMREVSTSYRYVRGHMCPKDTAERISEDAAYNTHTMMNAVPQLQWQNNGIWKKLEAQCLEWADNYGSVWVVAGPIFFGKSPAVWLGQDGEMKVAVPDALFKIVIREDGDSVKAIAFIIPNVVPKEKKKLNLFLSTVQRVEDLTGLDFLTVLDDSVEEVIEGTEWEDFEAF